MDKKDLASSYLDLLAQTSPRPIALFSENKGAMSAFLDCDVKPIADSRGFLIVRVDAHRHQSRMVVAISELLEDAFNALLGQGALAAGQALPEEPVFRMDSLVNRIGFYTTNRILLLIENIDALCESKETSDLLGSIRAVLQTRHEVLFAIFTGSSRGGMAHLFWIRTEPLYQFAHQTGLP